MQETEYMILISGKLSGELTEEDNKRLEAWLAESADHRKLFEDYSKLWSMNAPRKPPGNFDLEENWKKLAQNLEIQQPEAYPVPHRDHWNSWWLRAAAVITVLISLTFLVRYLQQNDAGDMLVYVTPNAVKQTIDLPDGSAVILNSGSELRVSKGFHHEERIVYLKGEGLFDIQKSTAPFRVITNEAEVDVLGTRFNVRTRDSETRVTVQSGTVRLANPALPAKTAIVLTKDEFSKCTTDEAPLPASQIDSDYQLGWLRNEMIFDKTPLKEVIAELQRSFNIEIRLEESIQADQTISGSFETTNPEAILDEITLTLNMSYQKRGNIYLLSEN